MSDKPISHDSIVKALNRNHGNVAATSRELGIEYHRLYYFTLKIGYRKKAR